jgi:hypothetical protein
MKKFLSYILILLVLVGTFSPVLVNGQTPVDPNSVKIDLSGGAAGVANSIPSNLPQNQVSRAPKSGPPTSDKCGFSISACFWSLAGTVSYAILGVMGLFLWIAGTILDFIVNYTIVNMASNISGFQGINVAWKLIKDLMNIAFIFLLVYEGIKMILGAGGGGAKKLITGIIISAILINFSLFFTKILIDASNIVSIGFYKSIITQSSEATSGGTGPTVAFSGLSAPFMQSLGLTSFFSVDGFSNTFGRGANADKGLMIMGIAGTVLFLVVAFTFLAIAAMLVVRFIVLILLLMTSPIAYMGWALPFMKSYADEWWNSLKGQLLFAPLYMIMTWVILTFMASPGFIKNIDQEAWSKLIVGDLSTGNVTASPGSIAILFNFIIIIGLTIGSIIIAKKTASKGSSMIGQANKWATSALTGAVAGTAAFAGRNSFGWLGNKVASNVDLQREAKDGTGMSGAWARAKLYGAQKARSGSFDVRAATIPTNVVGDFIQGTAGRTDVGKKLGLNNVKTSAIEIAAPIAATTGAGKAGTKGYKEIKAENAKEVKEREAAKLAEITELTAAENKKIAEKAVKAGAKAGATTTEIEEMEKALTKLSDKETEAIVSSNRELLESQNFANSISVKQLEALNKSEQFSDQEKTNLKNARFDEIKDINDAAGIAALAIPAATRTPAQVIDAARVEKARKRVKELSDSELEMISPNYLDPTTSEGKEFISQLKGSQVETITNNKNGKFSATQKDQVMKERMRPLKDALAATPRTPAEVATIQSIVRKADIKTKVNYLKTDGGAGGVKIGLDPAVLVTYTVKTLQRMAAHDSMTDDDISTLRAALLATLPPGHAVVAWLNDPNKGMVEFPA